MMNSETTNTTVSNGMISHWWKLLAGLLLLREALEVGYYRTRQLPFQVDMGNSQNNKQTDDTDVLFNAELVPTLFDDEDEQSSSTVMPLPRTPSPWCPAADCTIPDDELSCNLCDDKFLILLSLGRSASTTLTWTLDALPGIRMGGENNGVINKLKDLMDDTAFFENNVNGEGIRNHPWGHAPLVPHDLLCAAQDYIKALYPRYPNTNASDDNDNAIIGFKTVRFFQGHTAERDAAYLEFLTKLFPCARFVVNYRSDTKALQQSFEKVFHANSNEEAAARIQRLIARSKTLAEQLGPERAYQLDSTEWTSNVTKLNGLVRWLGYGPECDFADVLELNTENGGYGNGKERLERTNNPNCTALRL